MASLLKTPIGVLVLDEEKLVDYMLFKKDPKVVAKKLSGECEEEAKLKKKWKAERGSQRVDLQGIAVETGFCSKDELAGFMREVNEELAKAGVKKGFTARDKPLIYAVRAHKELLDNTNHCCELLREWYSIHFPELGDTLRENRDYALFVKEIGLRKNADGESLKKVLGGDRFVRGILKIAPESIGSDIEDADLKAVQGFSSLVLQMMDEELRLRGNIEKTTGEIAPNMSAVATPYVGALLLEQAGSLERLASVPASTVQILGAQTAMFRFLKTGQRPPKYGVLYQHPLVSQAPKKAKGRMARTLAGKISIAAKVDFFRGKFIGDKLRGEVEERARRLKV
jgi:nucleolar protein 56